MPARKKAAKKAATRSAKKARKPAKKAARNAAGRSRSRSPSRSRPSSATARPDLDVPAGWRVDKGGKSLSREIVAKDFLEAVEVVTAIAPVVDALDHHPDLHLERWNHLRITTWSHDVGGITERDVRLAERVNEELRARGWG